MIPNPVPFVHRRWYALAIAVGLMATLSLLFSLTFPGLSTPEKWDVFLTQMKGPTPVFRLLLMRPQFSESLAVPCGSFLCILSHPLLPRKWTLYVTLIGGFFWWLYGWGEIVSGI